MADDDGAAELMRLSSPKAAARDREWLAARALVMQFGWNAIAYQILNPGMTLWFSSRHDAVAGYALAGRYLVIAGAPTCSEDALADVADELEQYARSRHKRVVFIGAGDRLERVYANRVDHALVRIGAQPTWNPAGWADIVKTKSSLRAQFNRARNKGVRIEEWTPQQSRSSPGLKRVLNEWLDTRGMPPMQFLVTPDLFDTLEDRRIFVAMRGESELLGYLVATPIPARNGWLVEQWPRTPAAPNGTTHLLVDSAMRAFNEAGAEYATLGLAPLSELAGEIGDNQPAWLRLALHWLSAHGKRFYNFRGLEHFKASLQPMEWEPIYAITPGKRFTPMMLNAIAAAFSGGSPVLFIGKALASAVKSEATSVIAATANRTRRP